MKTQIVLSGVGGQGLVSTGEILGLAASVYENIHATLSAAYGSETRGTFTKADMIMGGEPIDYPNIEEPDVILCLAQVAYDRYVDKFKGSSIVIYDSENVIPSAKAVCEHIGHPFRQMSLKLGNPAVANSIALGVMIKRTHVLKEESVLQAVAEWFASKPKVIGLNQQAVKLGLALQAEVQEECE